MKDHLPKDTFLRDYTLNVLVDTYKSFGFERIETPCMENLNLLNNGDSGENQKMIYKVLKRGTKLDLTKTITSEKDITSEGMRFDLTVPLGRFYANNIDKLPMPFKSIQYGPVWRAERPQKGRFRQFMQCDIDIIGEESQMAELDLILATCSALKRLDFDDIIVRINDRNILTAIVVEYAGFSHENQQKVFIILDKLDKIGMHGVEEELKKENFDLKAIDKLLNFIQVMNNTTDMKQKVNLLPNILDKEIVESLEFVLKTVEKNNINIIFDLNLVRGMGYYTGQIFEIEYPGYNSSIAGGGRYDKMISKYLNKDIPACGFSIGFERIISILEDKNFTIPINKDKIALIVTKDQYKDSAEQIYNHSEELRNNGNIVSCLFRRKNMHKQLEDLKMQNYTKFIIYNGPDSMELKSID
ncbi:histidine--tRNA ligase [Carnobacterium maltaromaticum]|uniref:histidine--tRNA ligase n=1 Tax=Carnobacterium maltaromaticum TaxID=2751 RepID=UPI00295EED91|nr:histidine--tRNA ligase [Carnobacterium maltaromaticum]